MRITHPQAPFQGVAPENVFFVANDQQIQLGTGYVIMFYQGEMYPERPAHLFIQMDAQPSARALLYGALLARAEQLRAQTPNLPARLYAQVAPENLEMLQFYEKCGLHNDDGEDLFRFPLPPGVAQAPMGMQFASVPLQDEASQNAFLNRINAHRIQPITRDYLQLWQQQQHFMALGFYRGGQPICETIITGTGANATLLMIYTRSDFRRQGLAKQLLGAASALLKERGVTQVYTHIFRRNAPQAALMKHLNGAFVRTVTALPGLDL
ncbi:MAG: GNAT family N-acetyltransferase [Clostridiales bacterium]|nr:GNAT family N-acetyltransferase [Clostridiales bacterium]